MHESWDACFLFLFISFHFFLFSIQLWYTNNIIAQQRLSGEAMNTCTCLTYQIWNCYTDIYCSSWCGFLLAQEYFSGALIAADTNCYTPQGNRSNLSVERNTLIQNIVTFFFFLCPNRVAPIWGAWCTPSHYHPLIYKYEYASCPSCFLAAAACFQPEKYLNLDVICLKLAYICVFLCRSLPADLSSLSSPASNASALPILCDSLAG